ncbi:MAG TPA: hypothetical protein VF838_08905 [Trebonia sp.]
MSRISSLAGTAAALALAGTVLGCGAPGGTAVTTAVPPTVPGQATAPPDLTGVQLPSFVMPQIKGGVSRPNPRLTPGSVVTTSADTVCAMPMHGHTATTIPFPVQTAVLQEYGYTTPSQQHKYMLTYLVPVDLGGGTGIANIWPIAIKGAGFYQKTETDHILRDLVCRRTLSLTEAQRDVETDWYAAWLRYVVATGHA